MWLSNLKPPEGTLKTDRQLPTGLRFEILKRDNFTCRYCGRSAPHVELHVDHIIPWSEVKKHELPNLITACKDCNLGKSNKKINC